jgi:hypothetical protein
MITLIPVYHNGMVITNGIGSYEFVGMKKKNVFHGCICKNCLKKGSNKKITPELGWLAVQN